MATELRKNEDGTVTIVTTTEQTINAEQYKKNLQRQLERISARKSANEAAQAKQIEELQKKIDAI